MEKIATGVVELAAAWALESQQPMSDRRRAQRDAWLSERAEHGDAYRTACDALTALDRHAAQPEILALRQAALAAKPERNASSMLRVASVAMAVVLASLGLWTLRLTVVRDNHPVASAVESVRTAVDSNPLRYATTIGERSTVDLADGSVMVLNTASTAEVVYSRDERAIRLLQGQALFTVAHGQPLPFRVYAGDRIITAVGTVFDVRLDGQRVQVAMLEGTVHIDAPSSQARPQASGESLSAGETFTVGPAEPVRVKVANVERVSSWRSGLLTFEDTRLADAIAEINRYTARPLQLADEQIGNYRVSGTFRVGDPERFARTMTEVFPLRVERTAEGNAVLTSRVPVTNK
jgi:transmembrane sensor